MFFYFNIYIILVSSDWNIVVSLRSGLKFGSSVYLLTIRHAIYYLLNLRFRRATMDITDMYMEEPVHRKVPSDANSFHSFFFCYNSSNQRVIKLVKFL